MNLSRRTFLKGLVATTALIPVVGFVSYAPASRFPILEEARINHDLWDNPLNGRIVRLTYWNKRLPDATLVALTAD